VAIAECCIVALGNNGQGIMGYQIVVVNWGTLSY